MKNMWDEEVEDHLSEDCPSCNGDGVYKLPFGCTDDCDDEDNCYCECHLVKDNDADNMR